MSSSNVKPTITREEYEALLASASTTAGSDSWKTCSGRLDGPDTFIPADAFRCVKRVLLQRGKPPKGTKCPVCLDDPMESDGEWYITKSCHHAVCRECLQSYASSLISNPEHSGPLLCPCCPRLLRVDDARVALSNTTIEHNNMEKTNIMHKEESKRKLLRPPSKRSTKSLFADSDETQPVIERSALDVLQKWDAKVRDEFLRSMTDFRPCPNCSEGGGGIDTTSQNNQGGGFVTPECLAPINEARETFAECAINMAGASVVKAVIFMYGIYYLYVALRLTATEDTSAGHINRLSSVLQIFMTILSGVLMPVLSHVLRLVLAKIARKEITRPIIVTCPCCDKDFNLEASSEFQLAETSSTTVAESATQHWKNSHTRPCPGCSSPIMKDGGCNHVKCGRCRVEFCWACMRSRTRCRAYQCKNGADYGNAFGDGSLGAVAAGLAAGEREGRTLMERIEYVESDAIRNLRRFKVLFLRGAPIQIAVYLGLCINPSVVATVVSASIRWVVLSVVTLVLISLGICCVVVLHSVASNLWRQSLGAINLGTIANQRNEVAAARRRGLFRQAGAPRRRRSLLYGFRTEEEMFAEAVARSLIEH